MSRAAMWLFVPAIAAAVPGVLTGGYLFVAGGTLGSKVSLPDGEGPDWALAILQFSPIVAFGLFMAWAVVCASQKSELPVLS